MTQHPEASKAKCSLTGLGSVRKVFTAKTKVAGQDGGAATALLMKGFREGLFDAAVLIRRTSGYHAEPYVAYTAEEAASGSGTIYLKIDVIATLRKLLNEGKQHVAVVATPCQAAAARNIQKTTYPNCELTIIGLFCYEAFNHQKLQATLKNKLNIDLDAVAKAQVKEGKFVAQTPDRGEVSCKVKDLDNACEAGCRFCVDFTSQESDVSVGSVGSPKGYSTVIVRTPRGERLVTGLEASTGEADCSQIMRVANLKSVRAEKNRAQTHGN